jgi:hypothetical protein
MISDWKEGIGIAGCLSSIMGRESRQSRIARELRIVVDALLAAEAESVRAGRGWLAMLGA